MFVFKKNENLRLCVDYRHLNKITKKNHHSLFLITQILNQLSDSAYFINVRDQDVIQCDQQQHRYIVSFDR